MSRQDQDQSQDQDEEVEQELKRLCAEMKRLGARAVVLFGSRARGQHTEESDADVCLIADGLPEDLFPRRYPAPSGYRHVSVFGFHPQEFLKQLREANALVLEIVHEGRLLYDDGFFGQVEATYQEVLRLHNLRRTEKGWDWTISL